MGTNGNLHMFLYDLWYVAFYLCVFFFGEGGKLYWGNFFLYWLYCSCTSTRSLLHWHLKLLLSHIVLGKGFLPLQIRLNSRHGIQQDQHYTDQLLETRLNLIVYLAVLAFSATGHSLSLSLFSITSGY